jgi:hypothetical protein
MLCFDDMPVKLRILDFVAAKVKTLRKQRGGESKDQNNKKYF